MDRTVIRILAGTFIVLLSLSTVCAAPVTHAIRSLPADLTIDYSVQIGEGSTGFVAGQATYNWRSGKGRYSMVSTLKATGLVALFVHGSIVQVSQGRLTSAGLQPEQYWVERNGRKKESARFDWASNQILMAGDKSAQALRPQAQDLLSFPFQLALTARPDEPDFSMWVTNGRKFRDYAFHVVGEEVIKVKGNRLSALHLRGSRAGEGTLDVWLDLSESGLPVQIRTQDTKGKTMLLTLEKVSAARAP